MNSTQSIPDSGLDDYFQHARAEVLPLLRNDIASVVDIGGASGATLSLIKEKHPSIRTICADAHAPALEIAARRGHVTIKCDLDRELPDVISQCDAVLCLDVLEHLVDPWTVLRRIFDRMRAGGQIIVSLPNVRFLPVSAGLLFAGSWELKDAGVLDRTHLRFFTRRSAIEMFDGAGFHRSDMRENIGLGRKGKLADRVTLGLLRDLFAVQFIMAGTK